ncbi:unnamed protein product [Somion occarium]|uniref:Uncharacterized protein n=1 Tax=Somion occarium TaxID=3059160 RepID=A0ABP1E3U2_9APHY
MRRISVDLSKVYASRLCMRCRPLPAPKNIHSPIYNGPAILALRIETWGEIYSSSHASVRTEGYRSLSQFRRVVCGVYSMFCIAPHDTDMHLELSHTERQAYVGRVIGSFAVPKTFHVFEDSLET